jgi:hypothetical protein
MDLDGGSQAHGPDLRGHLPLGEVSGRRPGVTVGLFSPCDSGQKQKRATLDPALIHHTLLHKGSSQPCSTQDISLGQVNPLALPFSLGPLKVTKDLPPLLRLWSVHPPLETMSSSHFPGDKSLS